MIPQLWIWLAGYVVVKLKGPGIESFLNRAIEADIQFWQLERLTTDVIVARLSRQQFAKLRPLLWEYNLRVSILEKAGLPFMLNRVRGRQFLFVGLLLFCLLLYYLSGFIWFIEISGNDSLAKEEIMNLILGEGIEVGLPKDELSPKQLETRLLTTFDQLAWAGVELRGVLLRIEVVERSMPDPATQRAGDIIAENDGLLTQVLPFNGSPHVAPGSTVQKGDLLISGEYYDQYGRRDYGRAEGIALARVWYEAFGEAAFSKIVQEPTGNTRYGLRFIIRDREVLIGGPGNFRLYQVESTPWEGNLLQLRLPLEVYQETYHEIEYVTERVPEETARELALKRAWDRLADEGVDRERVKDSQIEENMVTDEHGIRVTLTVEIEKDIGKFRPAD